MKKSKSNTTPYTWGTNCKGWHLAKSQRLHIIEEVMPAHTAEKLHYHAVAEQFFYILHGKAVFEIGDEIFELVAHEGISVAPQMQHCIKNETDRDLTFLVISQPTTRGDRFDPPFSEKKIYLHGKQFTALHNSANGEVGAGTVFSYFQKDDIVWATYEGGSIKFGTLSGKIEGQRLEFNYQHQNTKGEFLTGHCTSTIQYVDDKIQLHEQWQWTCKDHSKGTSILVEM